MPTGRLQIEVDVPFNHEGACEEDDPEIQGRESIGIPHIDWTNLNPMQDRPGDFEHVWTGAHPGRVTVRQQPDGSFVVIDASRPITIADNTLHI